MGDVYLKSQVFNRDPLELQFQQNLVIGRPILKANPSIQSFNIGPHDKFVIFASAAIWRCYNNMEAATIVRNNPRDGAAGALMREALGRIAQRRGMNYHHLRRMSLKERRNHHDDICVVVLYLDELQPVPNNGQ